MEYEYSNVVEKYKIAFSMTTDELMKISDEILLKQPVILQIFLVITKRTDFDQVYLDSIIKLTTAIWLIVRDSPKIETKITEDELKVYFDNDIKLMQFLEHEDVDADYDAIIEKELSVPTTKNMYAIIFMVVMNEECKLDDYEKSKILFYLFSLIKCLTDLL